jgi:acyl-coenzyme A thioesterase PaaI-like protein
MPSAKTHLGASRVLVGEPLALADGSSTVRLQATPEMTVDESGLTHGGFIFGVADFAAMLAVNHPNVVLGAAQAKFTAPVRTGDVMIAEAKTVFVEGKKREVSVTVKIQEKTVFTGTFTCITLDTHVLKK